MQLNFLTFFLACYCMSIFCQNPQNLNELEQLILEDFKKINYPPVPFGAQVEDEYADDESFYDVVIVGGGMAGLSAAAALSFEGIFNIQVFDQNPAGFEGPWLNYAYMKTLRSKKTEVGIAFNFSNLTFEAWFTAQFGKESFSSLGKIPTSLWMDYLTWYQKILDIPLKNNCKFLKLHPKTEFFELEFEENNEIFFVKAYKVVLATGQLGFGGASIPKFAKKLPSSHCRHISEMKDFHLLKEKTVGIVGSGSSAFDAAAVALEMGAFKVEMLMRRSTLAKFNRLAFFHQQCLGFGYYYMDPAWKWEIMKEALSDSIAPPVDSLKRVSLFSNFELISSVSILDSRLDENLLIINTNQGEKRYDFLILATGYQVDGYAQKELSNVMDHIFLWRDCQLGLDEKENILGLYPYLGDWFQFTEKFPGEAPYLKDVHCFNHASTLSHGIICRNIPLMSIGAERLAKGIVVDFLKRQETFYLNSWHELKEDFEPTDYF